MRRLFCWTGMILMLPLASGCSSSELESVVKDALDVMKAANRSLASIKDKASAEKAAEELNQAAEKTKELTKRLEKIGKPSKADNDAASRKYGKDMEQLGKDISAETTSLRTRLLTMKLPQETLQKIDSSMKNFGQALIEFSRTGQKTGLK